MKLILQILSLFFSVSFVANAAQELRFIVNHPGSAPYLYYDETQKTYKGVIPDVLKPLIENKLLSIKYISNSRKRSEEYMYQGTADMIMLSKSWLKYPDKLIATVPLHQHKSYLYKAKPFPTDFTLSNDLKENLCTRKGYIYPNLSRYIDSGRLIRTDSSDHLSMFRMLFKHRCDYAIMNEFNAANLMNSSFFTGEKLYRSKIPISTVPLNIVLRPELTDIKSMLDKHIEKFKNSKEIQRLINKHITISDFS